jgi:translation initiation factor IF-2
MGRVRTLHSDRDILLDKIGPSTPAQVAGLDGIPQAGDSFMVVLDEQEARDITAKRSAVKREHEYRRPMTAVTLDKVYDQIQEGQIKEVRLIIKGDVDGSVEVLSDTLGKIATSEVKTNIIRRGVGPITESDVLLAAASTWPVQRKWMCVSTALSTRPRTMFARRLKVCWRRLSKKNLSVRPKYGIRFACPRSALSPVVM